MLQFAGLNRSALPRASGAKPARYPVLTVCRSSEQEGATSVVTVERPVVADSDAKVKATISSLDALLGSQDTPSTSASRTTSTPTASSPSPSAASSSRPAAPQLPKLPSLSLGAQSSDSKGPAGHVRKPAGITFDQVMGFSGLAPEVINGRAAMIGFLMAISQELKTGESVFSQMVSGGAGQALLVFLVVSVASFAPVIRGKPLDEVFNKAGPKKVTEWGPFTAAAEGLNGRLAMVGIALLLFFEGAGPTAFFLN